MMLHPEDQDLFRVNMSINYCEGLLGNRRFDGGTTTHTETMAYAREKLLADMPDKLKAGLPPVVPA